MVVEVLCWRCLLPASCLSCQLRRNFDLADPGFHT